MKRWIRRYLGIDDLVINEQMLLNEQAQLHDKINAIKGQIIAANRGMGRLLAKLDPLYGTDELDSQRIADSDKLSDQIIKKLIAEHIAGKDPNDAA